MHDSTSILLIRFSLAVALIIPSCAIAADLRLFAPGQPHTQIVRGVSAFDFFSIQESAHELWVVVEIVPSPIGPHIEIEGAYFKPGKFVVPPGARTLNVIDGSCHENHLLTGVSNNNHWKYRLELPGAGGLDLRSERKWLRWIRENVALAKGGLAICHIEEDVSGTSKFDKVVLIPSSWQRFILPALEYLQKYVDVFDVTVSDRDQAHLEALIDNDNPFISVAAFRRLVISGQLDSVVLQETLKRAEGLKEACLVFLLLTHVLGEDHPDLISEIDYAIESALDVDSLSGIVLGSLAAAGGQNVDKTQVTANGILEMVSRAFPRLSKNDELDQYLSSNFGDDERKR